MILMRVLFGLAWDIVRLFAMMSGTVGFSRGCILFCIKRWHKIMEVLRTIELVCLRKAAPAHAPFIDFYADFLSSCCIYGSEDAPHQEDDSAVCPALSFLMLYEYHRIYSLTDKLTLVEFSSFKPGRLIAGVSLQTPSMGSERWQSSTL